MELFRANTVTEMAKVEASAWVVRSFFRLLALVFWLAVAAAVIYYREPLLHWLTSFWHAHGHDVAPSTLPKAPTHK